MTRFTIPAVGALAMAAAALAGPGLAQDYTLAPAFGDVNLASGFSPDPHEVAITAGGGTDAAHLGGDCVGFVATAPDVDLYYDEGDYILGIYVESAVDTTLVVNAPDGSWYCNDDFSAEAGRNPGLVFEAPQGGLYDIWVGTNSADDLGAAATVVISERYRWGAEGGSTTVADTSGIDFGSNDGTYPDDGECDDPRFEGDGMAAASSFMQYNRGRDAEDCLSMFRQGRIALADVEQDASPLGETIVSSGTGFYVSERGHVLTNHHVIDGCVRNTLQIVGEPPVEIALVASHPDTDLAILKAPGAGPDWVAFRSGRSLRQGDEVVVFGFPLYPELSSQGNLTDGLVVALSGMGDNLNEMQISAPIQHGNSGGPVMDRAGNVVGVVVSKIESVDVQNVNFAVRGTTARNFLDTNNIDLRTAPGDAELSIADIGERARDFTGLILCYQ